MKRTITIVLLLLYSIVAFAQHEKDLDILKADSTWLKEIIKFPLGFAQDINYKGYEDLRFAKDWSKPEGSEFFTYAFVWNINLTEVPTANMLETNMKLYYDGLMTAVNKDEDFTIPESLTKFYLKEKNDKNLPSFIGEMKVYDSFFTKRVITLFADVETIYCKQQNKYLMLFRVSTLHFEDSIWYKLQHVTLNENACEVSLY